MLNHRHIAVGTRIQRTGNLCLGSQFIRHLAHAVIGAGVKTEQASGNTCEECHSSVWRQYLYAFLAKDGQQLWWHDVEVDTRALELRLPLIGQNS